MIKPLVIIFILALCETGARAQTESVESALQAEKALSQSPAEAKPESKPESKPGPTVDEAAPESQPPVSDSAPETTSHVTPEPSDAEPETPAEAASPESHEAETDAKPVDMDGVEHPKRHFSIGGSLYYNFATQLVFSNVTANSSSYTYKYNLNAAPGIGVEIKYTMAHAWGAAVGIEADGPRTMTDFVITGTGSTQTGSYASPSQPRLSFIDLYASARYQWDKLYLPFGLNLSGVGIDNPPIPLKDMSGSLGGQVGLGYDITTHVTVEGSLRALLVAGKSQTDSTSGTTNVQTGYLMGAQVGIKAFF